MITFNQNDEECQTVIVSGCGRSGTTAMSRICAGLGFEWIEDTPTCQEHSYLRKAVEERDLSAIGYYVRNVPRQGIKLPMIEADILLDVSRLFPKCQVIYMLRDTLSVMESHIKGTPEDRGKERSLLNTFAAINAHEINQAKQISRHLPTCLVSYEKLITYGQAITRGVAEFLKVPWRQDAADEIRLQDTRYRSVPLKP